MHSSSQMLQYALWFCTGCVTLAMLMLLWRLIKGPYMTDQILALDTLYMSAIALIVLLGMQQQTGLYFEAALLVSMLGFVSTVALARYVARGDVIE